jgi:uncharacterized protein YdhG (YjbR/CyaY superfamily)
MAPTVHKPFWVAISTIDIPFRFGYPQNPALRNGSLKENRMRKTTPKTAGKSALSGDVDGYLAGLPIAQRRVLTKLRKTIKAAAPKAQECISWRMPAYKYLGFLVFFAAFKNHCSFFVASTALMKKLDKELVPYETSGGTIHFTPEKPLPATLVKKIVKARIKENEMRKAKSG